MIDILKVALVFLGILYFPFFVLGAINAFRGTNRLKDAIGEIAHMLDLSYGTCPDDVARIARLQLDTDLATKLIQEERKHQDPQTHSYQDWVMILMEDVGKLALAEMDHRRHDAPKERIKEELVQVCAVAKAMLEDLLRKKD